MNTPRYQQVAAAHAKLTAKLKAGVYEGARRDRVLVRIREYELSLGRLEGATNRRVETPSVGPPGATIGVGPE